MRIGVPKEIKTKESRVALLPRHAKRLTERGQTVLVQTGAGALAGFPDADYRTAGATVLGSAAEVYGAADTIVKVKEPLHGEYALLRSDHTIIANLYCERDRALLDRLLETGATAVAAEHAHPYRSGNSPLAGEVGALEGLRLLLFPHGGPGRHFARHFGVEAARVLVIGLGQAGRGALRVLLRIGSSVVGMDEDRRALEQATLDWESHDFTPAELADLPAILPTVDLVLNCVKWDKRRTDHLITRAMLAGMRPGAVIVDVSCDRAGAIETSVPTSWDNPTYKVGGVTHFCVENLPSAVPGTGSASFAEAVMPIIDAIAAHGLIEACRREPWLAQALVCHGGLLHSERSAQLQGRVLVPLFG